MKIGIVTTDGRRLTFAEAIEECLERGSVDGWPLEAILALQRQWPKRHASPSDISSGAYRKVMLQEYVPYYVSLRGAYGLVRGIFLHWGAERGLADAELPEEAKLLTELRLTATLPCGLEVAGFVDAYSPSTLALFERKTASSLKHVPLPSHVLQAQTYAWLLRENAYPVEAIYLVYYGWYAPRTIQLDVWGDERLIAELTPGALVLQRAISEHEIPPRSLCNKRLCRYCDVKPTCEELPDEWTHAEATGPSSV